MMSGIIPKLVWRAHGEPPGGPSKFFIFFIVCTEVNAYPAIKCFLNVDKIFEFLKKVV